MKMSLLICGEDNAGKTTFIENINDKTSLDSFIFKLQIGNKFVYLDFVEIGKNDSIKELRYLNYHFLGFVYIIDYDSISSVNLDFITNKKKHLEKNQDSFWSFLFFNCKGNSKHKLGVQQIKQLENFANENDFFFLETNFLKQSKTFLIKKLLNLKLIEKNSKIFHQMQTQGDYLKKNDLKAENQITNIIENSKNNNRYQIREGFSSHLDLEDEYSSRKQLIENLLIPFMNQSINSKLSLIKNRNGKAKMSKKESPIHVVLDEDRFCNMNRLYVPQYKKKNELNYEDFDDFIKNEKNILNKNNKEKKSSIKKNVLKEHNGRYDQREKSHRIRKEEEELINNNNPNNLSGLNQVNSFQQYSSIESNQLHALYKKIHNISMNREMSPEDNQNCESSFFSQKLYEEINYQTNSKLKNSLKDNSKMVFSNQSFKPQGLTTENKNLMELFENLNSKQTNLSSNLNFTEIDIDVNEFEFNKKMNFCEKIKNCDQLISLNQNMISELDSSLNQKKQGALKSNFVKKKKPHLEKVSDFEKKGKESRYYLGKHEKSRCEPDFLHNPNKIDNSVKIANLSNIEKIDESENIDASISNILQKFDFEEDLLQNVTKVNSRRSQLLNFRESHDTRNNNYRLLKNNKIEKLEELQKVHYTSKTKLIELKINNTKLDVFNDDTADSITKSYFDQNHQDPGLFQFNRLKKIVVDSINQEIETLLTQKQHFNRLISKNINKFNRAPVLGKQNEKIRNMKTNYSDIRSSKILKNENFYKNLKSEIRTTKEIKVEKTEDLLDSFYEQIDKKNDFNFFTKPAKTDNLDQDGFNEKVKKGVFMKKEKEVNKIESYIDNMFDFNSNISKQHDPDKEIDKPHAVRSKNKSQAKKFDYNSYKGIEVDKLKQQKNPVSKKTDLLEKPNGGKDLTGKSQEKKIQPALLVENEIDKNRYLKKNEVVINENKLPKKFDVKINLEDNPYELAMQIISNNHVGFNHFDKIVEGIKAFQNNMKKKKIN